MNKSRLNSIKEELSEKPKAKKHIKDQDYQSANFRDYIKTDHKSNKFKHIIKKSYLDDKEINFLTKDATLLNLKQKQNEFESATNQLKQQNELQNIKSKFNQNIRNPNIQNLLIDIRTKSGVNQLQEDLKKEFDTFLNASFNFPTQTSTKKTEWNYLTLMDYNTDDLFETKNNLITKNEKISINKEIIALNNKNETKSSKSAKSIILQSTCNNKNDNNLNKKEDKNNMQVALIHDEKVSKSKPLIELNKMLESIKR
jgi:hypothetical protein